MLPLTYLPIYSFIFLLISVLDWSWGCLASSCNVRIARIHLWHTLSNVSLCFCRSWTRVISLRSWQTTLRTSLSGLDEWTDGLWELLPISHVLLPALAVWHICVYHWYTDLHVTASVKPMTHAPVTGAINSTPDSGVCVSYHLACVWRQTFSDVSFWSRTKTALFLCRETRPNGLLWLVDEFVYIGCFHCLGCFNLRIDLGFKGNCNASWECKTHIK